MVKQEKYQAESMIRIAGTDIRGNKTVYAGLTKIKGISWAISNAICKRLNIDKKRKVQTLTEKEIEQIIKFIKSPNLPAWLLNRRKDFHSGKDRHNITTDLDLQKEFDVRRMKKIKSYKGIRHSLGLPVRGQKTRGNFRKGKTVGVSKKKGKPGKK